MKNDNKNKNTGSQGKPEAKGGTAGAGNSAKKPTEKSSQKKEGLEQHGSIKNSK